MQKLPSVGKFHCEPPSQFTLFNHLIGAGEQRRGHRDAEDAGCSGVDNQLELARLHHWQVGWLLSLEDATRIDADLTIRIRQARSIAHQPASFYIVTHAIYRG